MDHTAFDLTDPDSVTTDAVHVHLKYLRENAPISRITSASGRQYWALVKYRDIMRVWGDPQTFPARRRRSRCPSTPPSIPAAARS